MPWVLWLGRLGDKMIECKFKFKGENKWNYKDFSSEEEMNKYLNELPQEIGEYKSRPKKVSNPFVNWFKNIKNTRKNWKVVQGSPYARLNFALKARKAIVLVLIPLILWMGYRMVTGMHANGIVGTFSRLVNIGVIIFICYKVYMTIPQAKRQIEYYKKYPHTINYCPTNVKETVDDIFNKIENNKKEVEDVRKK